MSAGLSLFIGGPLHGETKHLAYREQPYRAPKSSPLWTADPMEPAMEFMTYRPERIGMFRRHILHVHIAEGLSDDAIVTHLTTLLLTDLARSLA